MYIKFPLCHIYKVAATFAYLKDVADNFAINLHTKKNYKPVLSKTCWLWRLFS